MKWVDRWLEGSARRVAQQTSRRNVLTRLGTVMLGAATLPLLPVARGESDSRAARPTEPDPGTPAGDPSACEYWRHCAIDGFPCSCCGGTQSACPPGTELALMTWIGTCTNPVDKMDYIISYNDCCGKSSCGRCMCNRNEGDKPQYRPSKSNDINWCQGTKSNVYHCTIAAVIGTAVE